MAGRLASQILQPVAQPIAALRNAGQAVGYGPDPWYGTKMLLYGNPILSHTRWEGVFAVPLALLPFVAAGLLLWCRRWRAVDGLLAINLAYNHLHSRYVAEFATAAAYLEPGGTMLLLDFTGWNHSPDGRHESFRLNFIGHPQSRFVAGRPVVDLNLYQASTPNFPVRYRFLNDPYIHLRGNGAHPEAPSVRRVPDERDAQRHPRGQRAGLGPDAGARRRRPRQPDARPAGGGLRAVPRLRERMDADLPAQGPVAQPSASTSRSSSASVL